MPVLIGFLVFYGQANSRVSIPLAVNLKQEARTAQSLQVPLLLMFSFDHCPYCAVVREEFLEPMKISGDYENKVLMRIVEMDGRRLIDFSGEPISTDELSRRYDVTLGPTVILVDVHGRLLAEPLVGLTTPDFYGGYLDEAIAVALKKIK